MLRAPSKKVVRCRVKGREAVCKVKTTSMIVKSTTLIDKSTSLIDKSTSMICLFSILGIMGTVLRPEGQSVASQSDDLL